MTNQYYTQPYNLNAQGFYFTNYESYCEKAKNLKEHPVEEFELQIIDATSNLYQAFNTLEITQVSLAVWFDEIEYLEYAQLLTICFLADQGYALDQVLDEHLWWHLLLLRFNDYIDSTGLLLNLPDTIQQYFDSKSFAHDLILGGNITEWCCSEGHRYIIIKP